MSTDHLFLTLTSLADATRHHEYNAWHQLDHLPENLVLPGVAWGDRWVRTPACAAASHVGEESFASAQYAVAYGFRAPVADAVAAWTALNQRALWWGRRPELAWTDRRPVGFFHPVQGYAAPAALVAPAAVPLRPHRGVHLTVSRLADPGGPEGVETMREHDRTHVPALLDLPGVAGVWTFRFASGAGGFGTAGADDDPGLLVRLVYCDGDPLVVAAAIEDEVPAWVGRDSTGGDPEHTLLSSTFLAVEPWQWGWFDEDR